MNGHSRTVVSLAVISLFIFGGVLTAAANHSPSDKAAADQTAPDKAAAPVQPWSPKSTDWPTFHDNNARTGLTAATATMKLAYYKWTAKTGAQVVSSPAVATVNTTFGGSMNRGSKIFVGSIDSRLYCIDGGSGNILWRFQAGSTISSSPAVGDLSGDGKPKVVFGSYDGRIYCLDCMNGSLVWRYQTRAGIPASPALADLNGDGKLEVAIGGMDGIFYVLDADGKALWTKSFLPEGFGIQDAATVGDVNGDGKPEVLVQSETNNLTCVNGADGEVLWNYTALSSQIILSPFSPVIADLDGDGKVEVLVLGNQREASCLDGNNGSVKWHQSYSGTFTSTPAIGDGDGDGKPDFFACADNTVFCAGGSDGLVKWTHSFSSPALGAMIESSPALADIDGDGKLEVIACTSDHVVRALNAEDGSLRWAYPVPKPVQSSPAVADIDGDGKAEVVFGCNDGRVYALDYNF